LSWRQRVRYADIETWIVTREERRYMIAKRMYGDELPDHWLRAHARHPD